MPDIKRRHRLVQKPAAFALGAGLLAVPLVPITANAVLPERDWSTGAEDGAPLELITDNGETIRINVDASRDWQITDYGSSATLRGDGTVVVIEAYDRVDRDPAAVAQRLMRANRIAGISAALDGGVISSPSNSSLSGDTCVAVTTTTTGTCAFLYDDDIVVSVIALNEPDSGAVPITSVADMITREQQ